MKKIICIAVAAVLCVPMPVHPQSATHFYPLQHTIIAVHGNEINSERSKNTGKMAAINAELHPIAQMTTKLEKWQAEYNYYLKDTTGIVSALRSAPILYTQGAVLLQNLYSLQKAVTRHPEGLAASVPMNNLYMETGALVVRCYSTLKKVITKGGPDNMLTGAERAELLWSLAGEMHELNDKIRKTSISIAYYELTDVWHRAVQGMYEKDHTQIANESLERWKRAYKASRMLE